MIFVQAIIDRTDMRHLLRLVHSLIFLRKSILLTFGGGGCVAGGSLSYTAALAARTFSFDGRRSTGVGSSIGSLLISTSSLASIVGSVSTGGGVGSLSFS